MKSIAHLESILLELFATQYFASFATHCGENIHSSLVAFVVTEDLKTLYLCTSRATRKYANIRKKPSVSLLIHNSSNAVTDVNQAVAVTVTGTAREVPEERLDLARALYLAKHPHFSGFVTSPNTAFIEVTVASYDVVTHFQDVVILKMVSSGMEVL